MRKHNRQLAQKRTWIEAKPNRATQVVVQGVLDLLARLELVYLPFERIDVRDAGKHHLDANAHVLYTLADLILVVVPSGVLVQLAELGASSNNDELPKSEEDDEFDAEELGDGLEGRELLCAFVVDFDEDVHGDCHRGEVDETDPQESVSGVKAGAGAEYIIVKGDDGDEGEDDADDDVLQGAILAHSVEAFGGAAGDAVEGEHELDRLLGKHFNRLLLAAKIGLQQVHELKNDESLVAIAGGVPVDGVPVETQGKPAVDGIDGTH